MEKLWYIFAFMVYFRFLFQANQFLMLSSFSELLEFKNNNPNEIMSLFFAFLGLSF